MLQHLSISRPLAVFDTETTGTDPKEARIVEISIIRLEPDGSHTCFTQRVNPGVPIPAEASAVHGIFDHDVRDCPRFGQVAEKIVDFLEGCDLAGYNVLHYDLRLLLLELARVNVRMSLRGRRVLDPMRIYHEREKRDLSSAVRLYCRREHDGAHGAEADALAALSVLDAQVERYEDLPRGFDELHSKFVDPSAADLAGVFRRRPDGEVAFAIGKYKDHSLANVARLKPDYLEWMLREDFLEDAKELVRDALQAV